jgi:hypothetical protein
VSEKDCILILRIRMMHFIVRKQVSCIRCYQLILCNPTALFALTDAPAQRTSHPLPQTRLQATFPPC